MAGGSWQLMTRGKDSAKSSKIDRFNLIIYFNFS
jgi:hypothetical protein